MQADRQSMRLEPFPLLLERAVHLTRQHFRAIYPAVAGPLAIAAVALILLQQPYLNYAMETQQQDDIDLGAFMANMAMVYGFAILSGAIHGLGTAVMLAGTLDAIGGTQVNMAAHWRWVFGPRVQGTILLIGAVILLGIAACCLPGMVLGLLFGLTVPVMIVERRYGIAAASRAVELIRYNPERKITTSPIAQLFVIGLVGVIISNLVALTAQLPLIIAQQVILFRSIAAGEGDTIPEEWVWLALPQGVIGTLASVAVGLYICFTLALFFQNLRRGKDGYDLDAAMDLLGAPPGPGGSSQ